MFGRINTYLRLLCLGQARTANDCSAVLLAGPAEVCHWPCNDDMWEEVSPHLAEGGVPCRPHGEGCACPLVHPPYSLLCGGRG